MGKKLVNNMRFWCPRTPVDGNGAAYGGNHQFACMKDYAHATFIWIFGNLAADATISIQQAINIGGSDAKALNFKDVYKIPTAAGTARDQDTPVKVAVNAATLVMANGSEDNFMVIAEFEAEELDVQNRFDCVRPVFSGGSGAILVTELVIFSNARYLGDPQNLNLMHSVLQGEQEVS